MIAAVSAKPASSSAARIAADAAVHHVGRRDQVGAGPGVRDRHVGRAAAASRRCSTSPVGVEHAAVAVRGVRAEADVGGDRRAPARRRGSRGSPRARGPRRPTSSTPARPSSPAARTAARRRPRPRLRRCASAAASSGDTCATPGRDCRGRRTPLPGTTKRGRTNWAGSREVSRTRRRRPSRRRKRRGRVTGNVNAAPGVGRPRAVSPLRRRWRLARHRRSSGRTS